MQNYSLKRMADDALNVYNGATKSKKVVISGYYGYKNIGDDVTLHCIIKLLRNAGINDITVLSANPESTEKSYGVKAVNRYDIAKIHFCLEESDVFMLGGGNLIQNQTSNRSLFYYGSIIRMAKKRGNYCIHFSCGIGELSGIIAKKYAHKSLELFDCIYARSKKDYLRIKEYSSSSKIFLSGDVGFLYENEMTPPRDLKKYFIVCLRQPRYDSKSFEHNMVRAINSISKSTGLCAYFIPMHPEKDGKFSFSIAKRCKNAKFFKEISYEKFNHIMKNAEFSIGMRLHTMILSIVCNTPHISLPYDQKCFDMYTHINSIEKKLSNGKSTVVLYSSLHNLSSEALSLSRDEYNRDRADELKKVLADELCDFKLHLENISLM